MILNTLNDQTLYESIALSLKTSDSVIKAYVKENASQIVNDNYNDFSLIDMDLSDIKKKSSCFELNHFTSLIMHHISPRFEIDSIQKEGLLTLPNVLTKQTCLSKYLKKKGFEFAFQDNEIKMKRHNEEVNLDEFGLSNLKIRLCGLIEDKDFNVNGYLFANVFRRQWCDGWLGSPEILKSLSVAYHDKSIADDYASISGLENYLISFKVPVNEIELESSSDIAHRNFSSDSNFRTEYLLKACINELAHKEESQNKCVDIYNPVFYLSNDYNVPGIDIKKIWVLKHNNGCFYPLHINNKKERG